MTPLLVISSVVCAWALLSVLSGERQRYLGGGKPPSNVEPPKPSPAPAGKRRESPKH